MKKNTLITLSLVAVIIVIGVYVLISSKIKVEYTPNYKLEDYYVSPKKNFDVNEYRVVNIDDNTMVKIYFNTYISLLFENIKLAYLYLDEESQLEQYPNIESFNNMIAIITNNFMDMPIIDKYEEKSEDGKIIYTISDKNGHIYIFNVESVMNYTVSIK